MNWRTKSLLLVGCLAAASCATAPEQVKIRAIADPASKLRASDDVLADAKGQLAIGNTGLALEGFRRASREHPDNAEAFAGLAACYDMMGRYDLAQSNYEAALALQPRSPALLGALATSLERQGRVDDAREVMAEVAELNAAAAALDQTPAEGDEPVAQPATAATTTVMVARSPEAAPTVSVARIVPVAPAPVVTVASAPVVTVALPPAQPLVTVALPPARPVASLTPQPHATPVPISESRIAEMLAQASAVDTGPRLERLSLGEVALVTSVPAWRGQVVASSKQSVTVRWVPLNVASARPNIRLLNAARRQGLAARNRDYLLGRGWRKIEIGDSTDLREESLVLYPAARSALGRSLAAQFGFRARAVEKSDVFVVLLGRDAVRPTPQRG